MASGLFALSFIQKDMRQDSPKTFRIITKKSSTLYIQKVIYIWVISSEMTNIRDGVF